MLLGTSIAKVIRLAGISEKIAQPAEKEVNSWLNTVEPISQKTYACLKSTIETLEKGVKHAQKLAIKTPEWRQWHLYC